MKTLIKLVVGLVVVLIVLAVMAGRFIDSGAKTGIETIMTERLGVPTTLDEISISLFKSSCEMNRFEVRNPDGFSDTPFFAMGRGFVAVSGKTLMDDVIEVPKLELSGIRVNLEQNGTTGNYTKILEAMGQDEGKSDSDENQKRFIIREVIVKDTVVKAEILPSANLLGDLAPPVTLKIPTIRLTDVGSETGKGAILADVAAQIMSAVFVEIGDGAAQLPSAIGGGFSGALKSLPNIDDVTSRLTGGIEKGLGGLIDGGTKKIGEGLEKGLGDLLGR